MQRGNNKKLKIIGLISFVIIAPIITVTTLVFVAKAYFNTHRQENVITESYEKYENSSYEEDTYTNTEDNMNLVNGAREADDVENYSIVGHYRWNR